MVKDQKGMSLVILGVVSVIAVIGLVMMFTTPDQAVGQFYASAKGGEYLCNIYTNVGEPQWFPILSGAAENEKFAGDFLKAGYQCAVVRNGEIVDYVNNANELQPKFFVKGGHFIDEFGYQTLCCRNPKGVPVLPRSEGDVTLQTRRESGLPVKAA